jgi:hypothetical protein
MTTTQSKLISDYKLSKPVSNMQEFVDFKRIGNIAKQEL